MKIRSGNYKSINPAYSTLHIVNRVCMAQAKTSHLTTAHFPQTITSSHEVMQHRRLLFRQRQEFLVCTYMNIAPYVHMCMRITTHKHTYTHITYKAAANLDSDPLSASCSRIIDNAVYCTNVCDTSM